MGVIGFKRKLSSINQDDMVRVDTKFGSLMGDTGYDIFKTNKPNLIPLKQVLIPNFQLFNFEEGKEYFGVPTGKKYTNEYGDITTSKVITKDDHPNRLRYKLDEESILISSLKGARTPALNFDFDLSNYVFSNGFYIFKVAKNWNKDFVLLLLRTERLRFVLNNNLFRGIGISSYKESDLLKIEIPYISIENQSCALEEIIPIKKELMTLKGSLLRSKEIINHVFSNHFKIDLDEVESMDETRFLSIPLSNVKTNNSGLRGSLRWNKMQYIQNIIYSKIDCIQPLSRFIKSTKNGWSPLSVEGGEGVPVLGQEHFDSNATLNIDPSKSTVETRNNIEDFFIKKGDFFVSRGNTVNLVALASVVTEEIENDIIYPDLYIKIEFDESNVDKEYLAFLFNSFIGRMYFKYVAKGKNQTMVKVSAAELLNFRIPVPSKQKQAEISQAIKTQLSEQKEIAQKIKEKQQAISKIIEDTIKM
jgi:type I restriction enzyme S subunit